MAKLSQDKIEWILSLDATSAQQEIHTLSKENQELEKNIKAARKAMATHEAGSKEWLNASNNLSEYNKKLKDNKAEIDELYKRTNNQTKTLRQLRDELKKCEKEFANCSKAVEPQRYKELYDRIKGLKDAIHQATHETEKMSSAWKGVAKLKNVIVGVFTGIGLAITGELLGAFKNLIKTVQDFGAANSRLAAILGTTREGMKDLTDQAKELGRTTTATASEVTGLQTELAKLGFTQQQILDMTPSVLKFAKSVGTDLASAAAFAGASLRIFGKDSKQTEETLATLAIATNRSVLDFSKLEASMATIGPVANAYGLSIEDTVAMLGALSNAGFDASSAATATRNILLNLSDANGDLAKALGGPVKNLDDITKGLNKLNSEGVDLAKVLELTDKRSVAAFSSFLAAGDSMIQLRDSITDCTAEFDQMKQTMGDNAAAARAGLSSAIEGLMLKFEEGEGIIADFYRFVTVLITGFGNLLDILAPVGSALMTVVGWIKSGIEFIGRLTKGVYQGIGGIKTFKSIIASLTTAFVAFKTAITLSTIAQKGFTASIASSTIAMKAHEMWLKLVKTAQDLWNNSIKANPIAAVISAVAALSAGLIAFISSRKKEIAEIQKAKSELNDEYQIRKRYSESLSESQVNLKKYLAIAQNELISLEQRRIACKRLNEIVPEYNAHIEEGTRKFIAASEALEKYNNNLMNNAKLSYYHEGMEAAYKELEKQRTALEQAKIDAAGMIPERAEYHLKIAQGLFDLAESKAKEWESKLSKAVESGAVSIAEVSEEAEKKLGGVAAASSVVVDRIKEIDAELKKLRKTEASSDDEYKNIQKRIEALKEEKKILQGKASKKHETGTYKEGSLDEATADADLTHQKRLLEINKQKPDISQYEYVIAKSREMIRWYEETNAALADLAGKTAATHTQTLDKIAQQQAENDQKRLQTQQDIDKATVAMEQQNHSDRLAAIDAFYSQKKDIIQQSVNDGEIAEDAAAVYRMSQDRAHHSERLAELQAYLKQVEDSDIMSFDERKIATDKLQKEISSAQSQVLTDTGNWMQKMRELTENPDSGDGIMVQFEIRRKGIVSLYDAMITAEGVTDDEVLALASARDDKLAALDEERRQKLFELAEITGVTWADEYDNELAKLKEMHRQGLISEGQYQKARTKLQADNAKKYFDLYSGQATSMFSAIQDAEISASDAKYDVLIQQAKNNGEDTTALEEEKENKKLEIQKKYADVNFAIKVSTIVADTAVAIMKAFADLGPIGGAISAAMLTATGIAQIAMANSERQKIKNLQPSHTASQGNAETPKTPTATRKLTGYSEGGYTGDGGRLEVAGVVHKGEYVVPKPIMGDPLVVDAVAMIESIRRDRMNIGTPMSPTRFADGGHTSPERQSVAPSALNASGLAEAVSDLRDAAESIRKIRAYVVLRDIEDKQDLQDRARAPFTRGSHS